MQRKVIFVGAVIFIVIALYIFNVQPATIYQSGPNLEATKERVDVDLFGSPVPVTHLVVTNKGRESIKIYEVQVNDRKDPDCDSKPNKLYDVGAQFDVVVYSKCGELVRATVKTDHGDLEFNW